MKQYAFFFNSSVCSGCKTCQMACRDKHNLKPGIIWRRVQEVTEGNWRNVDGLWVPDLVAYNISLACNHCEKPACVTACQANAIVKRKDGIVIVESEKCMGIRDCERACPYGALQFDKDAGIVTKCHFCFDEIDQGKIPACVSACPMRALDFGELSKIRNKYGNISSIYPLPKSTTTSPALVIKPHRDVSKLQKSG